MIPALVEAYTAELLAMNRYGLTLADQWAWIVAEVEQRTGLPAEIVEADLHANGFVPTAIELVDDEVCEAMMTGAIRRLDAVQVPHNHSVVVDAGYDFAALIAERVQRINDAATVRDRALAEICFHHRVDAYVAARALSHFDESGFEDVQAAVAAAEMFINRSSEMEH